MGGQGGQGLGWGINDLGKGRWQSGMLRVIGDSGREQAFRESGSEIWRGVSGGSGSRGRGVEGGRRIWGDRDLRRGSKIRGRGAGSQGFRERVLREVRIRGVGVGKTRIWEGGAEVARERWSVGEVGIGKGIGGPGFRDQAFGWCAWCLRSE